MIGLVLLFRYFILFFLSFAYVFFHTQSSSLSFDTNTDTDACSHTRRDLLNLLSLGLHVIMIHMVYFHNMLFVDKMDIGEKFRFTRC